MADSKSPEDRSMSEILASIRRIVSDEEKARREAENSRRTHEKEAGESVLTLTPDMSAGETKGESLSDALGVPAAVSAEPSEPAAAQAENVTRPRQTVADALGAGSYELPALELGEADRAPEANVAEEPLVLRRSSLRRETDHVPNAPTEPEPPLELSEPVAETVVAPTEEPTAVVEETPAEQPTKDEAEVEAVTAADPVDEPMPKPAKAEDPAPELEVAEDPAPIEAPAPVDDTPGGAEEPTAEPVLSDTAKVENSAAAQVPVQEVTPEPVAEAAPEPVVIPTPVAAAPSAPVEDADEEGLLDDEVLPDPLMTEAEVEAIVRRVVREELQGPIGQQISRKVKRLIKDEIRKALYEDDSLI